MCHFDRTAHAMRTVAAHLDWILVAGASASRHGPNYMSVSSWREFTTSNCSEQLEAGT